MTDSTDRNDATDATNDGGVSRRRVLSGAVGAGALALGGVPSGVIADSNGSTPHRGGQRFRVRIENVSTPSTLSTSEGSKPVPLSPGAYAVHSAPGVLVSPGDPASPGIEDVAEDGRPGTLVSELSGKGGVKEAGAFAGAETAEDPNQPAGAPEPPIFPGGAYEFTVSATPGDSLSLATMFIQSNDLFYAPGPGGIDLFERGTPVRGDVTDEIGLWDASTEIDQEPGVGADQAPRQSGLDTGADDDNSSTVRPVSAVNAEGHDYPDPDEVIKVTVEPVETRPFKVRVENVSTPSTLSTSEGSKPVPLSPGAYAVHTDEGAMFSRGEPASDGLEDVAEDGMPGVLAEELAGTDGVVESGAFAGPQTARDPNQPAGAPEPPIFPGGAYEFTVRAAPGDSLSLATMFIQSNDLFYAPGPDGIDLFEGGRPVRGNVTDEIGLWDAGTEVDQEPGVGADQAPRQSGLDTGADDDDSSTVQPIDAVNAEGHDYPDPEEVIRVSVEPVRPMPFKVRVENVSTPSTLSTSEGSKPVPLSPGAYATHGATGAMFSRGDPASAGLEDVAEDGMPGVLARELADADGVTDSGVFALDQTLTDPNQPAGAPEPPIFPGGAYEFVVSALPGDRLSLATMFIQSNDLFYAPGPDGITLFDDGTPVSGDVTDEIGLWDASTEIDQEPGVGADQAPRQSGLDTGADDDDSSTVQPVSAVNAEGHDYPDPEEVIRVTVEAGVEVTLAKYTDSRGVVEDEGLRAAVRDAKDDVISRETLVEIVRAYRSGRPLS